MTAKVVYNSENGNSKTEVISTRMHRARPAHTYRAARRNAKFNRPPVGNKKHEN
jgi:hypothetical protein